MKNLTKNLTQRDVTGGMNGYPEPYLGKFIYGFENLEEAEKYAADNKGSVYSAHWRDGWSNCELYSQGAEEYTPDSDDYGDDYMICDDLEDLKNEAFWHYNDIKENEGKYEMDEEERKEYEEKLSDWKRSGQKLIAECESVNWEKESVILYQGNFHDTIAKKSMSFYHDTHHYEIGVMIWKEDADENA